MEGLGLILVILGIALLLLVIILIDSIIEKYFCNMIKYRIVKVQGDLSTKYIIQRRFLWFFWIYVDGGYPTYLYTLEEVKSQIERLKRKETKKEVVYEEQ